MLSCLLLRDRMHQNITAPNVPFLLWQIFSLWMTTEMEMPTCDFCLIYINHELNIMASWVAAPHLCQGLIQPSKSEEKQTAYGLEIARKGKECSCGISCCIKGRYWLLTMSCLESRSLLAKKPHKADLLYFFFNQTVATNMFFI